MAFAVVFLPTSPDLNGWTTSTLGDSNNCCISSNFGKQKGNKHVSWWMNSATIQKRLGQPSRPKRSFLRPSWHAKGCFDSLMFLFGIKTPQGVGVEHSFLMSIGSCCSPWWINSCNPSLGFDELLYWSLVWFPHEKSGWVGACMMIARFYDLKYSMDSGQLWKSRKFYFQIDPCHGQIYDVETGDILVKFPCIPPSTVAPHCNLQQICSQVVCGCFHLFVVQPSCSHKKQIIS